MSYLCHYYFLIDFFNSHVFLIVVRIATGLTDFKNPIVLHNVIFNMNATSEIVARIVTVINPLKVNVPPT